MYIAVVLAVAVCAVFLIKYFSKKGAAGNPAFKIGEKGKGVAELNNNVESNVNFYKTNKQIDFSSDNGKKMKKLVEKQVLQAMINSEIIEKLAEENKIFVSDGEITDDLDKVIKEVGDKKTLEKNLSDIYGWTIEDFKNNVVRVQILRDKLSEKIMSDEEISKDAYDKISDILEQAKSGRDFAELAKENSECPSSAQGGSLGDFAKIAEDAEGKHPHMVEPFEEAAFALNPGGISDIVKTQFGYHIIKLEEKKTGEDGVGIANARHILIKTKNFEDWLAEERKGINVEIFVEGYKWENGEVIFSDEEMRNFELEKSNELS